MIDRDLPLKREISDNIKRLIKERGWTQLKVSEVSGISKSTLSDYINCKTLINPGNVEKLAEAFKVSKADIDPSFKGSDSINEHVSTYKTFTTLPIIGSISCGNGVLAYEDIEGYETLPSSWLKGGEYLLLKAKGDSMVNARIHEGDLLLIRKQSTFENGEIVAVLVDDQAYLKRVYKTDSALILNSENPKYGPIIVDGKKDIVIIGKLKKAILNY